MLPFPQTLLLWRLERGLTQAEVSRASGVPRPNLANLESGQRDATLKTLFSIARALNVKAGVLVDGVLPCQGLLTQKWGRERLERIAEAVAKNQSLGGDEEKVKNHLAATLQAELASLRGDGASHLRRGSRKAVQSRLWLKAHLSKGVLQSLIVRVKEHAKRAN